MLNPQVRDASRCAASYRKVTKLDMQGWQSLVLKYQPRTVKLTEDFTKEELHTCYKRLGLSALVVSEIKPSNFIHIQI